MDILELTRALVDIESVTNREEQVADFLFAQLSALAARYGGQVERMPAAADRDNIFAFWGNPVVTLSTHMDTVPPFFGCREDAEFIWGRAACDTKGIIASMIHAAESLLAGVDRPFALLIVVVEDRNSAGAYRASQSPIGSN